MDSVSQFIEKWSDKSKDFKNELDKILNDENVKTINSLIDRLKEIQKPSFGKFASISARDYAVKKGINPEDIKGTGINGKITKKDLIEFTGEPHKSNGKKSTKEILKEKIKCCGKNAKGEPCVKPAIYQGMKNPDNWFCGVHRGLFDD